MQKYDYSYGQVDLASGTVDVSKNNGQLGKIESFIGANKQWSQRFGYDELGRLSEAREYKAGDNSQLSYKQKFDFDRFGNLYRKNSSNPTTGQQNPLPYTPIEDSDISKTTNRFTSATGTVYDEAGQVVTDNKFRNINFAYDANGRQVKATKLNVPDALTVYDALGNRVATKINDVWQYVIYDAFGKLVAEYGIASEGLGGVKYVQQDSQGSVRSVTNNSGFVVARTDHQAFGEEIGLGVGLRSIEQGYSADAVTRQGYGLTENDESSGQQHTWFRKLEQKAGRWTSPDPYKGSMRLSDPQSFNRFSYVTNDPINFVDPSGLDEEDDGEIIRIYTYDSYLEALLWLYFGGLGRELYLPISVPEDPPGVGIEPAAPPVNDETDCEKLANIVEGIAKSAKNAKDFADQLAKRFLGVTGATLRQLRRSNEIGSSEFGSSGFKEQFQDPSNQVRHFTAGLIAGYLLGATGGDWAMWRGGDDPVDLALNAVSTALGARIVDPTPATTKEVSGGYRSEMRRTVNVPANPGYTDLADRIRKQVCE